MKKRMFIILGAIVILFAALVFVVNHKNNEKIEKTSNPYGKDNLRQETIDQLDDPLYQNQIIPSKLDEKLENGDDVLVYFYQPTCDHCKVETPKIVPESEKAGVDLKKVNLLEFGDQSYWDRYFVKGTPTLVQYKDGKEEKRISGEGHTNEEYKKFFEEFKAYADKK